MTRLETKTALGDVADAGWSRGAPFGAGLMCLFKLVVPLDGDGGKTKGEGTKDKEQQLWGRA